jgi:fermentation-respiration switch protein FrsA (DUF1100 family)
MRPFVLFFWQWSSGIDIHNIRPVDEIAKISPRAVFIIDGRDSATDLMSSPYRLYNAAGEPKQIWVEDGVQHMGMYINNPQEYEERVIEFFDENLLNKKP